MVAEIFTTGSGILCGTEEAVRMLQGKKVSLWAVPEGEEIKAKDVVMRIDGPYDEFAMYETALLGILASSSGWATAAWECKKAAGQKPVYCFGARHLHPAVAPVMERASIIGGADNCSCILGAKLLGKEPIGTVPHAAVLIMGDTVKTALLYDQVMPEGSPRIILVDTLICAEKPQVASFGNHDGEAGYSGKGCYKVWFRIRARGSRFSGKYLYWV